MRSSFGFLHQPLHPRPPGSSQPVCPWSGRWLKGEKGVRAQGIMERHGVRVVETVLEGFGSRRSRFR